MTHPGAAWPALAAREAGLDLLNLGFSRAPPVVSFLLRAVGRGTRSREALVGGIYSDDDGQGRWERRRHVN